jgi:hypothetical protein
MTSPVFGQDLDDHRNPIFLELFSTAPGATMTLGCSLPEIGEPPEYVRDKVYTEFARTNASTTPFLTQEGDSVYHATVSGTIPESCWLGRAPLMFTYVRGQQDGFTVVVFDDAGIDCLLHEVLTLHKSPINSGYRCAMRYGGGELRRSVRVDANR